jgi:hypothetical protein
MYPRCTAGSNDISDACPPIRSSSRGRPTSDIGFLSPLPVQLSGQNTAGKATAGYTLKPSPSHCDSLAVAGAIRSGPLAPVSCRHIASHVFHASAPAHGSRHHADLEPVQADSDRIGLIVQLQGIGWQLVTQCRAPCAGNWSRNVELRVRTQHWRGSAIDDHSPAVSAGGNRFRYVIIRFALGFETAIAIRFGLIQAKK